MQKSAQIIRICYNNIMLKVIKRSIPVVAILAVIILGALGEHVSATQQRTDFVVRVNNSLSLIVPKRDILLMLNPNNDTIITDSIDVEVRTNNKNGATVYVSTNKNDGKQPEDYVNNWSEGKEYLYGYEGSTALIGRNTKDVIQTLPTQLDSRAYTTSTFLKGYWGVSADGEKYKGVGDKAHPTALYSVQSSGQSDTREVTFGARPSDNLLSDYYENTVIFTAVATYSPKTTNDIVFMQEIDDEVADSMIPNTQYQLRDMRDNKKYWVAKLADGNIWMTQNLDLELNSSIALTPTNTDIPEEWTPMRSTIEASQTINDSWVNDGTTPYSYGAISATGRTEVNGYINSATTPESVEGRYAFPFGTYKTKEECAASVINDEYCEHYNVGKYYNWAAAIAKNDATAITEIGGTATVEQSICPAKWRLPTGSSGSPSKGEFTYLLEKSNVASSVTSETGNTTGYYIGSTSNAIVGTPLFLTNAGTKSKGQAIEHAYGEYWTSSIHNEPNVDRLAFDRRGESNQNELLTNFYPNVGNANADLGVGRSIRCLVKGVYSHRIKYYADSLVIGEQEVRNSVPNYDVLFNPSNYISQNNAIISNNKYITGWIYSCDKEGNYYQRTGIISEGEYLNVGSNECRVDARLQEGQRVEFYSNGGSFDDSSDKNVVLLSKIQRSTSSLLPGSISCDAAGYDCKYSDFRRKNSIDEYGYGYVNYSNRVDAVTVEFGNSSYVDINLKYGTSYSSENICIIKGYYFPNEDDSDQDRYYCERTISGGSSGQTSFRIYSNVITIRFSPGSQYMESTYGYWAEFTPENGFSHSIKVGNLKIPSRDGYEFLGWSTDPNAVSPDFVFDPENNAYEYANGLKLYAVWGATSADYHSLIVSADNNVTNMTIKQDSMSGTTINGTRYGNLFVFSNLAKGSNYYLVPEFANGFEFENWRRVDTATGAVLSDTNAQNASYMIGDSDGAVLLTSKRGLISMQNFDCGTMTNIGDTMELVDTRDGSVYTVTRLADDKCWMTDNLRLDFSKLREDITVLNTNNPTPGFMEVANIRPDSYRAWCTSSSDAGCVDKFYYNTNNIGNATTDSYNHTYDDYGAYYNWYTATAGNGTYNSANATDVNGDICPSGWHLPSGNTNGEFYNLNYKINNNNNTTNSTAVNRLISTPNNFVFSGYFSGSGINYRNNYGYYATSTAYSNDYIYTLTFTSGSLYPGTNVNSLGYTYKTNGYAVRCVSSGGNILYDANGGTGGTTAPQRRIAPGSTIMLQTPNFGREGYGFAGWNTKADGTGTNYGPNETITMPSVDNLVLYAKWVAPTGTFQSFSCSSLAKGEVTALTDLRDGETYAVAKLADDKCWMIENLRLDFSKRKENFTAANTNNPESMFLTFANSNEGAFAWCNSGSGCPDVTYSTINIGTQTGNGVYYNWYTATAGYGTNGRKDGPMPGDICPFGWRLPYDGNDYPNLGYKANNDSSAADSTTSSALRSYPNNFVYSGYTVGSTASNIGTRGHYWTPNANYFSSNSDVARVFVIQNSGISETYDSKYTGFAVRCLAK